MVDQQLVYRKEPKVLHLRLNQEQLVERVSVRYRCSERLLRVFGREGMDGYAQIV